MTDTERELLSALTDRLRLKQEASAVSMRVMETVATTLLRYPPGLRPHILRALQADIEAMRKLVEGGA